MLLVEDIPSLLQSFDFFVQPSFNEGISNTILEAMSTELPVSATDVGGNPELVTDDREGQLFPVGDAEVLSGCIECYIDDSTLRVQHGTAVRSRVQENFNLDSMSNSYAMLYSVDSRQRLAPTVN